MAINLSGLAPITTAATALSNLILVSPQKVIGYSPQSGDGKITEQPPAILFHYEGEQSVALKSDITDHYIEDNTAIQDQWALRPETVTTHGYIGELNNVTPKALELLRVAADKLTVINAYTPVLSTTALIAYNEAFLLYQVTKNAVNSAVAAWSSLANVFGAGINQQNTIGSSGLQNGVFNANTGEIDNNQNKQQIAFQQFYGYWRSRTLFTVQTPWAVFQNMAIESLRAIQDAETRVISDFEVTFKMLRFASTTTARNQLLLFEGRSAFQDASLVNNGTSTPKPAFSLGTGLEKLGF